MTHLKTMFGSFLALVASQASAEVHVVSVDFLHASGIPTGTEFEGTEVGGLSGWAYNPNTQSYYAISDDRSDTNDARFYEMRIDLSNDKLTKIAIQKVVTLLNETGVPYAKDTLDPESIAFTPDGTLLISSEGDSENLAPPFVNEYGMDGTFISALPIPPKFLPVKGGLRGVRSNRAFENLTVSPDQKMVYVAAEDTLAQDGPASGIDQSGVARFIQYEWATRKPVKEFLYQIDPIEDKDGLAALSPENSIADILALDNEGTFLVLERYYDDGGLNTNKLYEVKTGGLSDVQDVESLINAESQTYAEKRLVFNFDDTGVNKDDFEGLVFGPQLSDGSQSLIVVSDNDFDDEMPETQVFLFSVKLSGH